MANVTRITAKESTKKPSSKKPASPKRRSSNPIVRGLVSLGGYFKGAWVELRQVRWPTRRATWELTLAVILFSIFFGVIILLLDALFKFIFELVLA